MIDLKGKKILITGANRGIGYELAKQLSRKGVAMLLVSRKEKALELLRAEFGEKHQYHQCDLSDSGQVTELISKVKTHNKSLFCLVNNAGIGIYKNLEDISITEWKRSLGVNLTAPFLLIQNLLEILKLEKDSRVINLGSGAGTMGMKGRSAYVASKFVLRGFSLSLADEAQGRYPHVSLVTLGSTLTNFGNLSVNNKVQLVAEGRAYFPVNFLCEKLVEIISKSKPDAEYVLYPTDYGFGEWRKP